MPTDAKPKDERRAAIVRQLEGLVSNIQMSAKALQPRLRLEEQAEISQAVEDATKALNAGAKDEGSVEELKRCLGRTEEAATIIGAAMLRPSPDEPRIPTVCSVCRRDISETLRCPEPHGLHPQPEAIARCTICGRLILGHEMPAPDPRGGELVLCEDCCPRSYECPGCGRETVDSPSTLCAACRGETRKL